MNMKKMEEDMEDGVNSSHLPFTTVGFEYEFAEMGKNEGPLAGVTHFEVAESQEKFAFAKLPLIIPSRVLLLLRKLGWHK